MKIKLIPIQAEFIKPLIYKSLEGDEDLPKYIPNPKETLEETVDRINNCIQDLFTTQVYIGSEIKLYSVNICDFSIGFTVLIINPEKPNELYSFAINHKWRTKNIVLGWLESINNVLGELYYLGLHKENTRAIDFFIRNGFTKDDETRNFVLLFNNFNEIVKQKEKTLTHAS